MGKALQTRDLSPETMVGCSEGLAQYAHASDLFAQKAALEIARELGTEQWVDKGKGRHIRGGILSVIAVLNSNLVTSL